MAWPISAQADDAPVAQTPVVDTSSSAQPDAHPWRDFIYGKPVRDGIILQPLGLHTQTNNKEAAHNNLVGIVYDSVAAGTFINSFEDRTWFLVVMRNLYRHDRFGIDYFAGALYGYKGQLSTVRGIPLRNTFLFTHGVNPVISFMAWYEVSENIQLQATLTPLVLLGGIKYNF